MTNPARLTVIEELANLATFAHRLLTEKIGLYYSPSESLSRVSDKEMAELKEMYKKSIAAITDPRERTKQDLIDLMQEMIKKEK